MAQPIFISYAATEDSDYAASLATRIEAELGLPAWYFERDEPAGVYYDAEIVKQIANCHAFVVLLSPASADSNFILMEVNYAQKRGKPIFPIVISPVRQGSRLAGMTDGRVIFRLGITNLIDARGGADPLPKLRSDLNKLDPAAGRRNTIRLDEALEALPTSAPADVTDLTGQTIRGYQVLRLVARTQSSVVYQAEEVAVKRQVALKAIIPEYAATRAFQKRFQAEAERIASLSDTPHIVSLFSFWFDDSGAYLVMPWMQRGTLNNLIGKSPNPPGLVARIVSHVGEALVAAHRQDILHLDIKPGNILLNGAGQAFLSDFGISRGSHEGAPQGAVMYTPGYAPPEQYVAGGALSAKTDIYSLAVVVAELLLGARLFVGAAGYQQQQRGLAEETFARLPPPVAPVLQQALSPDPAIRQADMFSFVTELETALQVARGKTAEDEESDSPQTVIDAPNPYVGIAPFQEQDASRFFGRAAAVKELLAQLAQPSADARFLAIAGASGSGKSSLVRAGLIPELRADNLPGSERWRIRLLTPGADPLATLASALSTETGPAAATLRDDLEADEQGLLRVVAASLPADPGVELLLVIDQFEELFTLAADPQLRRHVLASIIVAVRDPASRLRVIITLRGDFYDRPIQEPAFGKLLLARTFWVEPLSEQELEDAIVQPARAVRVKVERSLVREILAEMAGQPGMLPLLQYTLAYLFERREGGPLSLQTYRAGDGVRGTLSRRAAEIYEDLSPTQQRLAQQFFLRLVTPGEGVADTRRRVRRSELADLAPGGPPVGATATTQPGGADSNDQATGAGDHSSSVNAFAQRLIADPGDLEHILECFGAAEARLLTFDREPGSRAPTVEIAHEALLDRQRGWPILNQWVDAARDDLRAQRRLTEAAAEWQRQGRDDAFLATGGILVTFEELAQRDLVDLTALERGYLEASAAARERASIAEEERRDRELRQAQQLAEQAQRLATEQQERAEKEQALAEAQADRARLADERALQARQLADEQAERARLAALQVEKERELTTVASLRAEEQQNANRRLRRSAVVLTLALIATIITGSAAGVFGRQATLNAEEAIAQRNAVEAQLQVAESRRLAAEATRLVTTGKTEEGLLLAMEAVQINPNPANRLILQQAVVDRPWQITPLQGHTDRVTSTMFSPDGSHILTASQDGTARLWEADGRPLATLQGHTEGVTSAVFSPDGSRILTASADGAARLWEADGRPLATLQGHTEGVTSAVFSPDGSRILTASQDGTARLWEADGRPLALLQGHTEVLTSAVFSPDGSRILTVSWLDTRLWEADGRPLATLQGNATLATLVTSAVFSPDGSRILIASQDGSARLWEANGRPLAILQGHTDRVTSTMFSPDGSRILTASVDGTARLWEADGRPLAILQGHTEGVTSAVFSPDGSRILTASVDGAARLWEADSRPLATLQGHTEGVTSAVFSPDGSRILTASQDGAARLWAADGQPLAILQGHTGWVTSAVFRPDGSRILTASQDGTARLWEADGRPLATLQGNNDSVTSTVFRRLGNSVTIAVFSPDGSRILTASKDATRLWEADGRPLATLQGHTDSVIFSVFSLDDSRIFAVFSPDGSRILTASVDGAARLWEADGQPLATLQGHTSWVRSAVFSPDGTRILTASADGTAHLWEVDGQPLATLQGHTDSVTIAVFSPDGTRILTASADGTARLWEVDGQPLATLQGHTDSVTIAVFSPDGTRILTASADGTAHLWEANGQHLATLQGHTDSVASAVFSIDGSRILTASEDGTARLWEADGRPIAILQGHTANLNSAMFSPDDSRILTTSQDGTTRVWPVEVEDWLAAAACRVGRSLTDEEIQTYSVPTPLKFKFEDRQCPPVYS